MDKQEKIYHRDDNSNSSLRLLAKQIYDTPQKSLRILDVGCGTGQLAAALATLGAKTVANADTASESALTVYSVGLDISEASLAIAKEQMDSVHALDLSAKNLPEQLKAVLSENTFDVIVLADVLEHLLDPNALLDALKPYLANNGKYLFSVPNAAYLGALLSLYDDNWQYQEEGILDSTHVRFYTYKSFGELLKAHDLAFGLVDRVTRDLLETEFHTRFDSENRMVRDWLLAKPEGSTYQFIIEARPKTQVETTHQRFKSVPPAPPLGLSHIVSLCWQGDSLEDFSVSQQLFARGRMGQKNWLSFSIAAEKIHKIRLDFADRRSIYTIDSIKIFDNNNMLLWSSEYKPLTLSLSGAYSVSRHLPLTAQAYDPSAFLLLILDEPLLADGFVVEVAMMAPVGSQNTTFLDAVPLADFYEKLDEIAHLNTLLNDTRMEASKQNTHLETLIASERIAADKTLAEKNKYLVQLEQQLQMQKRLDTLASAQAETLMQCEHLQAELQRHQQELLAVQRSLSWRITKPLRAIRGLFK